VICQTTGGLSPAAFDDRRGEERDCDHPLSRSINAATVRQRVDIVSNVPAVLVLKPFIAHLATPERA